jgi:O-antigen/teichoic acid export membrane protein
MLLAPVVGGLLGWEPHLVLVVVALCTLLLTGGTGLSLGYLQIRRNSRALNLPVIAGVATRLVGTFAGWIAGSPMEVFMVIWAASIAVEYWLLDHAGRAEMKRDGIELEGLPAVSLDSVPGLKAFARIGRIQVLLDQVPQRLSTLVVGAGLGSGPGGLYRVCAECTTVLSRPTLMLKQSVLPEFVRLVDVAVADVLRMLFTLMMVATAIGGVVIMVVWWYGDLLLRVLFGPEFVVATPLLCWLLVAASIEFIGAALCPAGQALARSGSILICQAAGLAVMVLLQIPLQLAYGLHGAGASCVILLATLRIRSSPSPENAVLHRPVESTHRL